MDDLDRASEFESTHRQMALSRQLKTYQKKWVISALNCLHCDAVIPQARRVAIQGCQYCIHCQALAEQGKL